MNSISDCEINERIDHFMEKTFSPYIDKIKIMSMNTISNTYMHMNLRNEILKA